MLYLDGHSWMLESPNIKGLKNTKHGFLITFYKRCISLRQNNIEPFVVFDKIPTILDQVRSSNQLKAYFYLLAYLI